MANCKHCGIFVDQEIPDNIDFFCEKCGNELVKDYYTIPQWLALYYNFRTWLGFKDYFIITLDDKFYCSNHRYRLQTILKALSMVEPGKSFKITWYNNLDHI